MAVDNAKLVAAPMPVTVGSVTFKMSPMSDLMHEELNQWVRARHIGLAVLGCRDLPPDLFDRAVAAVARDAHKIEWNNEGGIHAMNTLEGVAQLLWISVKKTQPAIKLSAIMKAIEEDDVKKNQNEIIRVYKELNTVEVKNSQPPAE